MRYLNVASVFHHVQPINHLAPLVPIYLAQDRQFFLNVLIDLQIEPVDDNFAIEAIQWLPMPESRQQATEKEIAHRSWSFFGFSSDPAHCADISLDPHKDGQSRERILPTTATPPCPSGLTIAASPKLIWMPSVALMFGKCVISTVLVPVSGTVAIISFIFSTRCGHGGGTGAPAIGTNDSISSASDGSTRPNASRPVSRARHRALPSTLPTGMPAFRNAAPMARA